MLLSVKRYIDRMGWGGSLSAHQKTVIWYSLLIMQNFNYRWFNAHLIMKNVVQFRRHIHNSGFLYDHISSQKYFTKIDILFLENKYFNKRNTVIHKILTKIVFYDNVCECILFSNKVNVTFSLIF
jgi:hypothetical protein